MEIILSPVRMDATLTLHRAGDVLTINGVPLDLSVIPEGAILPREAITGPGAELIDRDITRQDGRLHLTLILPHAANAGEDARFPTPIIDPPDGPIALPVTHPEPEDAPDEN